ncbi:MAG: glucose-1-phosphate thymidylyltransferase [Bacillota bacterium]|jgi:NDP-sugar pyrophosphorylase family protein|nr:glucose-1-phosphate thymidylyltransferase [Bacillota bacterium]NLU55014.1 glucose-1-phosphate thymidylyltransferase [Bacillota bacterium]HOA91926.1 glucose-1-phosphate thymidylyltransferase [Bacillota bacterium]HOP54043.1 glucose-1-phosphate thymidylyltransferase [Bacillota bacterium]HPZ72374.1 glucose-1-phosphate thymidylyltransferase [Bacillota bacterium]
MRLSWQDLFEKLPFPVEEEYPWAILDGLDRFFARFTGYNAHTWLLQNKDKAGKVEIRGNVYIADDAQIESGATIIGPAYIGPKSVIRHGAYLRGEVYLSEGVIVGHATEVKRSLLLKNCSASHFNYVGDSVLGANVNLGAGVKISNFKNDGSVIFVGGSDTGMTKVGAFIGNGSKLGCNAVTAPGTVIGKNCAVYPLAFVRGVVPDNSIVKLRQELDIISRS